MYWYYRHLLKLYCVLLVFQYIVSSLETSIMTEIEKTVLAIQQYRSDLKIKDQTGIVQSATESSSKI